MNKVKVLVYDQPLSCTCGTCEPNENPELVRFSSDLDWLKTQGVNVERFNLSSNPSAFVQNAIVKKALEDYGNDALPLIIVNDVIVSKGAYPTRSELMKFAGIEGAKAEAEVTTSPGAAEPETVTAECGPGCDCSKPKGSNVTKIVFSLLVLAGILTILGFRVFTPQDDSKNDKSSANASAFTITQAVPAATTNETSSTEAQPAIAINENAVPATAIDEGEASDEKKQDASESKPAKSTAKIGDNLDSLGDLNKIALSQDAVFIFIPSNTGESIATQTKDAVYAAGNTLNSQNIVLGVYTLSVSSPDYAGISKQVQTPAILVASKGKGMAAVSGEITEAKLLQAYVATTRAGGCGPSSSCGPSTPGCN